MKTVLIKEMIKNRYRQIAEEQAREYYLTHDCFSGRPLKQPYLPPPMETDPAVAVAQQDFDYLSALLYPSPTLGHALAESFAALRKVSEQAPQPDGVQEKPSADLIRRITEWYDRYLAEGVTGLLSEQAQRLSPANLNVIKQAYPKRMALVQNLCILSAFWIRSPQSWTANGGIGLLEHLFVRYPAPVFLKPCWLDTLHDERLRWLLVYIAYAQGASLKQLSKHFAWRVENLKLWHELASCKAGLSPQDAVMYTEVLRLGGSEAQFERLLANEAYRVDVLACADTEAGANTLTFWYSMVHWLAQHHDTLVGVEYERVLSWARHQFTESSATGKGFSMQGRSFAKVLRHAQDYHYAILAEREARARRIEARRLAELARQEQAEAARQLAEEHALGIYRWEPHGWNWELADYLVWQFTELTTSDELEAEGDAMRHCVGSYGFACYSQESAIMSLRCNGHRALTIELEPGSGRVVQMFGYQNRDPDAHETIAVQLWLKAVVRAGRRGGKKN